MNKRLLRISAMATSIVAGGLLLAPATLADTTCTISGNGAGSHNKCTITVNKGKKKPPKTGGASQSNTATVVNTVSVGASTGGNEAEKNTGGNVKIKTGDASVDVTIHNNVNTNTSGGI